MSRPAIPSKRPAADAQEASWVADEDRFVLQQAKKKAALRVKGGRALPVDWLAVTLSVIDPDRNPLDDEVDMEGVDLRAPESVLDSLGGEELAELEKGIEGYVALESSRSNVEYWNTMKTICTDRRKQLRSTNETSAPGVSSIAGDLDKLLGPKTLEELEKLEKQIKAKLASDEAIDTDYWGHLLTSLLTYKARARLRKVTERVVEARMEGLRRQQPEEGDEGLRDREASGESAKPETDNDQTEPTTKENFAKRVTDEREKMLNHGLIPSRKRLATVLEPASKRQRTPPTFDTPCPHPQGPNQSAAQSAFDRDLARTLVDNEELLTTEVPVITKNIALWSAQHRPRKPRYFARVITGYEWNKYNQTHYDHDNPPPKVMQGYKFNILYPDLVDKLKAPTYKIEREGGRRRGEWSVTGVGGAGEGEEETCVIRFIGGAPYEDLGFRVVDREWDFSGKRERGFRSRFESGVLQVWFQFKKIYYRK